eukprot:1148863-Pelagomonas_calceolata.AAC.5
MDIGQRSHIRFFCHRAHHQYGASLPWYGMSRGLLGVALLGAWRWRAGEGESGRPGAWRTTLQIPISYLSGFLLG